MNEAKIAADLPLGSTNEAKPSTSGQSVSSPTQQAQLRGTIRRRSPSPLGEPLLSPAQQAGPSGRVSSSDNRGTKRVKLDSLSHSTTEPETPISKMPNDRIGSSPSRDLHGGSPSTRKTNGNAKRREETLAARVKLVQLPGDYMYGPSSSLTLSGSSSTSKVPYEGKGKGRAIDVVDAGTDMAIDGSLVETAKSLRSASALGSEHQPVRREEFVRLMLQALRDVGYTQSAEVLEAESGFVQEPAIATSFCQAILGGRWAEATQLLSDLNVVEVEDTVPVRKKSSSAKTTSPEATNTPAAMDDRNDVGSDNVWDTTRNLPGAFPTPVSVEQTRPDTSSEASTPSVIRDSPGRKAIFMILRQKYLELLEIGQTTRALKVLRFEVAPMAADATKLHALSGLMMCLKKADLYVKANWDGAGGMSRHELLNDLQEFLPTGLILPPRRLATLFDQARNYQRANCAYHRGPAPGTLLADHSCVRGGFPTTTTHVLAEHSNEVWVIEWSECGRYLASAGKDSSVIIWKVEPTPTRTCERFLTLKGHADPVTSLAWSADGTLLVSSAESTLIIWNTFTGAVIANISGTHTDTISQIRWKPDQTGFLTCAMDRQVITWTRQGKLLSTLPIGNIRIYDFALSPDGKRMIAVATMNNLRGGHDVGPSASRLPDRRDPNIEDDAPTYQIGQMEKYLVIYDLQTLEFVTQRKLGGDLISLSLTEDGTQALVSVAANEVQLWNVEDNVPHMIRRYTGHQHMHYHIRSGFGGEDETFVLSASEDCHVYVWHKESGALLEVLEGHQGVINGVAWNPVYPDIFASCSDDRTIRIWQPRSVADLLERSPTKTDLPSFNSNGHTLPPQIAPLGIPMGIDMDLVF